MNGTWQLIKNILQHQAVQLGIAIVGLIVVAFNIWWMVKSAPILANIVGLQTEVSANSTQIDLLNKYIPIIIQLQAEVAGQAAQLNRIETRVDSIDNFLRGYK